MLHSGHLCGGALSLFINPFNLTGGIIMSIAMLWTVVCFIVTSAIIILAKAGTNNNKLMFNHLKNRKPNEKLNIYKIPTSSYEIP